MWQVKVSPQHLLVDAYNLEVERRLAPGSRFGVTFAYRYYNGNTETIDKLCGRAPQEGQPQSPYSDVKGYGWELMHRIYAKGNQVVSRNQYVAYGLNYHKFDLDYGVLGWGEVTGPDGLDYYQYEWHPQQEQIKRYGVVAVCGLQQPFLFNRFYTDIYGGLGYHFTYYSNPESEHYQANILDYGHQGVYITLGFKLGYSF